MLEDSNITSPPQGKIPQQNARNNAITALDPLPQNNT
jgi:hypothetical protein